MARLLLEMLSESLFHSSGVFSFAEIRSWYYTPVQKVSITRYDLDCLWRFVAVLQVAPSAGSCLQQSVTVR